MTDGKFAERLCKLCNEWSETYCEDPPIPVASMGRMNSLLKGSRNPKLGELIAISEAYDVSINYLLTGDELFPSLHQLKKKDAEKILEEIEDLMPEIEY